MYPFDGITKHAVIECDFKVELMVGEINYIEQYTEPSSAIILLQLESSVCVYYRTADGDISASVPFDMLDHEDPWIRTTYFTPSKVIDRCNSYRISISGRFWLILKKAIDCLKELRISYDYPRLNLKIQEEPDFGVTMTYSFFCINYNEGNSFEVKFLVNIIMHNAIMYQHQSLNKFFDMLRMQTRDVNVTALKHICSYKHLVFDAYKRLKIVQAWLLNNPKLLKSSKGSDDSAEVRRLVITSTKAYCLLPEDIIDFFTRNMVNDNLGVICNAHKVHADQSEHGALDEKCLELAELVATTDVDFPKTGKLVTMPQALKPKMYPDFMGKSESQLYKSMRLENSIARLKMHQKKCQHPWS